MDDASNDHRRLMHAMFTRDRVCAKFAGHLNVPAHSNAETSITAAGSIELLSAKVGSLVLMAIAEAGPRGSTAKDLVARLGLGRSTIRSRLTELRRRGLIRDSGQGPTGRDGRKAIVWTAVTTGEATA